MSELLTLKRVANFIIDFATPCPDPKTETPAEVEMTMDNHHWVVLGEQQWYVPKTSVLYSEEDEQVLDFLLSVNECREV